MLAVAVQAGPGIVHRRWRAGQGKLRGVVNNAFDILTDSFNVLVVKVIYGAAMADQLLNQVRPGGSDFGLGRVANFCFMDDGFYRVALCLGIDFGAGR